MTAPTWVWERGVAVAILLLVWALAGTSLLELGGVVAVVLTFAHMQVSDRLAEAQKAAPDHAAVECWRKLDRYLVLKEVCWLVYFVLHGSWSAVAGVPLFLLYPVWRRWYRARWPRGRRGR